MNRLPAFPTPAMSARIWPPRPLKRRMAWQAVSDVLSRPQEALQQAEIASRRFTAYSWFKRGLFFADLLRRREHISAKDFDRIYHAILILLCRGS